MKIEIIAEKWVKERFGTYTPQIQKLLIRAFIGGYNLQAGNKENK